MPRDVLFRRATPDDNDAILGFMREQSMQARLAVRFERGPSYFALHEAHSRNHVTWIAIRGGSIVGSASVVVRPAYVDRSITTVAYFADLRQKRGRGLAGLWRQVAHRVIDEVRQELKATRAFFSILRDNRLARASILESPVGRALRFEHLRGYRTVSLVGRLPWPRRGSRGLRVRRATADDSETLREFVDGQSRELQFAPVFDRPTWQRRIEGWPDFGIGSFLIATDARSRIVGCVAPWDASRINRIVIDALPLRAECLRRAVNAASLVTGRPKIAVGPAAHLPSVELTHLRVENRDPRVLAALLAVAMQELLRSRRYALLSLCLFDGDPLWRALRNTIHYAVPMDLYHLSLDPDAAPLADDSLWPGFESYLA